MLIQQIAKDRIQAMKDGKDEDEKVTKYGNKAKCKLLGTLIQDATLKDKLPANQVVVDTIKRFIRAFSNSKEEMKEKNLEVPEALLAEEEFVKSTLSVYLPKLMSEYDIQQSIKIAKSVGNNDFGSIMKFFKENLTGKYDGGTVANLVKESLK